MITGQIEINSETWTEIAGGASRLQFSAIGSQGVKVHFTEVATPPNGVSAFHVFPSWPHGFDFDQSGYPDGQQVWAKSISANDTLTITRDANFYLGFIPSGSDALITADGDTFRIFGNG